MFELLKYNSVDGYPLNIEIHFDYEFCLMIGYGSYYWLGAVSLVVMSVGWENR